MTKKDHLLANLLAAGFPIITLFGPDDGPSSAISYSYQPQMTVQQHIDAQAMINGFDWSDAAHAAWILLLNRLDHIDDINKLQNNVLRAIVLLLIEELNDLREGVIGVVNQ